MSPNIKHGKFGYKSKLSYWTEKDADYHNYSKEVFIAYNEFRQNPEKFENLSSNYGKSF